MARRKRSYRRYAKAGLGTVAKPVMAGALTGIVQSFIPNDALGGVGDAAVPIAVGYFMKDKTLITIGGYQLGVKLASGFGAPKSSVGGGAY